MGRLDKLGALEEQLTFFRLKKYKEEELKVAKAYIMLLAYSIKKVRKIKYKGKLKLRLKLTELLFVYHKKLDLHKKEYIYIYMEILPINKAELKILKKKMNSLIEVFEETGVKGVFKKIKDLLLKETQGDL